MTTEQKSLQYYVLDVFTHEKFKGNQLAVVMINKELDLTLYHNISREFNYSETSFIHYSKEDKALKVRSFTSSGIEINGAGHNLLGAICLAELKDMNIFRHQGKNPFAIMKHERIPLSIENNGHDLPFVGMLQKPATLGKTVPVEELAAGLSLQPEDLVVRDWLPTVVKTEVGHLMIPIKSLDALDRAASVKSRLNKLSKDYGFEGCYCFTITDKDTPQIAQARFFNPFIGIDEDPATGSAAGPLGGFLSIKGYIHQNIDYSILQGVKMKQPSVLRFRVTPEGIWVSGSSVIVMEGILYI